MTSIHALYPADFEDWLPLWRGYLEFYEHEMDDAQVALTFERLTSEGYPLHGALARDDHGVAVGLVHWLAHPNTWRIGQYCYLEDLFTAPGGRGRGIGRALIEHVRVWAEDTGCSKVYWLTAESNATARALYDRVAQRTGMIQYAIPVEEPTRERDETIA